MAHLEVEPKPPRPWWPWLLIIVTILVILAWLYYKYESNSKSHLRAINVSTQSHLEAQKPIHLQA